MSHVNFSLARILIISNHVRVFNILEPTKLGILSALMPKIPNFHAFISLLLFYIQT